MSPQNECERLELITSMPQGGSTHQGSNLICIDLSIIENKDRRTFFILGTVILYPKHGKYRKKR